MTKGKVVISEASIKGEAVRCIMLYAIAHRSFSEAALRDDYCTHGNSIPFPVALQTAIAAGYLASSPVPMVYMSGFDAKGILKLKPSSAINCISKPYLTMP